MEAFNPDSIPSLAAGGTLGTITVLLLGLWLMYTGRIVRGKEVETWKATAEKMSDAFEKMAETDEKRAVSAQQLTTSVEKLVNTITVEQEVNRRLEERNRRRRSSIASERP